jgi:hypothetical protein
MRQKNITRLVVWALLCCCLLAIYFYRREGFSELAPATYLGWDGVRWAICDHANRMRGIESMPGGLVIVEDVKAMQVVDKKYILAKTVSGKLFLVKVDEWGPDDVRSFATHDEWSDALKEAGIVKVDLRDPASLYKAPR